MTERAYNLLLWLVSVIFAVLMLGFGNLILSDLPMKEFPVKLEQFLDQEALKPIDNQLAIVEARRSVVDDKLSIAKLQLSQIRKTVVTEEGNLQSDTKSRSDSSGAQPGDEAAPRSGRLEQLKRSERSAQLVTEGLEGDRLALDEQIGELNENRTEVVNRAMPAYENAKFQQELADFLVVLAFTLPMFVIAAWLVMKQRASRYWPLYRGFVITAVVVFFGFIIPTIPSYGGYVRYGVGIVLTIVAGILLIGMASRASSARTAHSRRRRSRRSRSTEA